MTQPINKEFVEKARVLGKHIFDWGMKSEGLFVEKYRVEREKAIQQVALVLQQTAEEASKEQIQIDAAIARYRDDINGPGVAGYILSQSEHRVYDEDGESNE